LFRGAKIVWAFSYSIGELVLRRPQTRRARAEWLTRYCRRVLAAAQISWSAHGPVPEQGAVISNHLTYVDILLHGALRPCVFISAIETRKMPLIGWMSMMAGTVYVTRGAGGSAAQAAGAMAEGFKDGLPIIFFPEGKTGVGDEPVLPVRSGLLANALKAGATITPGFIRYTLNPADLAAGRTTRDDVHWGDQTLPAHLWNLLGLQPIRADITFAPGPIQFSPEALGDRKLAAKETRAALLQLSTHK
jgi:1-acyl-sn-glycerol-3-phosphate acyltransferase